MPTNQNIFSRMAPAASLASKFVTLLALSSALALSQSEHGIVTAYYGGWEASNYPLQLMQQNGSASHLNYLIYSFADIDSNGNCSLNTANQDDQTALHTQYTAANSVNGTADSSDNTVLHGAFNQILELKQKNKNLRVLISIGGSSYSSDFANAVANPTAFAQSCVNMFIRGDYSAYGITRKYPMIFDGIDIDWEYPTSTDTVNYNALLHAFRGALEADTASGDILTAAIGPTSYSNGYIDFTGKTTPGLPGAATSVNYFNVMTYDYSGIWNSATSAESSVAPFSQLANDINTLIDGQHVPAGKIVLGIPFYGVNWTGLTYPDNTPLQTLRTANSTLNTVTDQWGTHAVDTSYSAIVSQMLTPTMHPQQHITIYHDSDQSAWAYNSQTGVLQTYDDPQTVSAKANWAVNQKDPTGIASLAQPLAGVMAWEIGQDVNPHSSGSLLCAMETAAYRSSTSVCGSMLYDFENVNQGVEGWISDDSNVKLSTSLNESFSSHYSMRIDVGFNSKQNPNVYVPGLQHLPAGATVQLHVWVPAGSGLASIDTYVQNTAYAWGADDMQTSFPAAGWYTFNATVPANAMEIGIQLNNPSHWTGTIYLDAVVLLP